MRLSLAKSGMKISIGENSHYSELLTYNMYEFMSCENFFRRSGLYCPVHGWLYGVLGNVSTSAAKKIGVGLRGSTSPKNFDSNIYLHPIRNVTTLDSSRFSLKLN